jgi:small-conductance mechanosensitive channel
MSGLSRLFADFFTTERVLDLTKACLILLAALPIARLAGRGVQRLVSRRGDVQQAQLLGRLATWAVGLMGLAWALQELGFKLGVLLGAAGVLTVAVGFASQTTLSNLISGFFLFGERPFRLGDWIEVDGIIGEVLSVDLMATKLRTAENHYVRIPNELMIKTKVKNRTRFPLLRTDIKVGVANTENLGTVRALLFDVASACSLSLDEPAPSFLVTEFGDGKVVVQLSVWGLAENDAQLRSTLSLQLHDALQQKGVRLAGAPVIVPS